MRTPRALIALAVALATAGTLTATAAETYRDPTKPILPCEPPLPPGGTCGDHYLDSVRIPLNLIDKKRNLLGFTDFVNTSFASTQLDLFKPGTTGIGLPEPTSCNGKPYGKTVWYDFIPTVDGDLLVSAKANDVNVIFDPVIALARFSQRTSRPVTAFACVDREAGPSEQLVTHAKRGRAYTIQIGGVGNAGGPLVFDVNFTPDRLRATSKLALQLTPQGVKLLNVLVKASRKARVEVSCKPSCGKRVKRGRKVSLNYKKTLRPGSKLIVRVTRGGEIGAYFAYKIRKGKRPVETDRCLNPGSKKPRKTCP